VNSQALKEPSWTVACWASLDMWRRRVEVTPRSCTAAQPFPPAAVGRRGRARGEGSRWPAVAPSPRTPTDTLQPTTRRTETAYIMFRTPNPYDELVGLSLLLPGRPSRDPQQADPASPPWTPHLAMATDSSRLPNSGGHGRDAD